MPSQRSVLAVVSSLEQSYKRSPSKVTGGRYPTFELLDRQRLVSFAVGDLPALAIGTLYRNGRPITRSKSLLKTAEFTLDFDRQRVFRLGETLEGEAAPVLSQDDLLLREAWPTMARGTVVALPLRDDPFGVCVPLAEVLRWSYGSSSRMLQAVLSGDLKGILSEVRAGGRLTDSQYDLTLPEGFVEADAHTLAWLAEVEDARSLALRVDLSVMVRAARDTDRPDLSHPSAVFPYPGEHTVRVLGRWITHEQAPPRFLVHRVLSTTFQLPFQVSLPELQHTPSGPGTPPQATKKRKTPPAPGGQATVVSTQKPRRRGNPARLPALPSQFSGQPVIPRPIPAPPSPAEKVVGTDLPTGSFSTGLGQDPSSRARRATLVHQGEGGTGDPPVQSSDFDRLRRVLRLLEEDGFQSRELAVNNPGGYESRFRDWFTKDGHRTACLIAQLELAGEFAYLFEKERTPIPREYGPLLIARHLSRREASEDELQALLDLRAGARTWPRTHGDWVLVHLPHSFASDQGFAAGISRRLGPLAMPEVPALSTERET